MEVFNFQTVTGNYFAAGILVHNCDLHARHAWLVERKDSLRPRLEGDPDWYDAKIAGWWVWGSCCWIGSGFCSGKGPWQVQEIDGVRQLVHLGNAGVGVNRKRVHLGNAGLGVHRQRVHLGDAGKEASTASESSGVYAWMQALADRLRFVRVCCGDWSRVCTDTTTINRRTSAVFLDPPYADTASRKGDLYREDSLDVAHAVREWAIERGDNPKFRIALCGYEGEHVMPDSWECLAWKTRGGYSSRNSKGNENRHKERIWFSPHCVRVGKVNGTRQMEFTA